MFKGLSGSEWIISPGPDVKEEEFEKFLLSEAFKETQRATLTRVTRHSMQSLEKCQTAEGKTLYVWSVQLDLMNTAVAGRIFGSVEGTMKTQLESRGATLSTALTRVEPDEGEES